MQSNKEQLKSCYFDLVVLYLKKNGNPVHWRSRIRRVWEGVPPFGVLYAALPCFYTRGCFQDLNPWPSHDNNFTSCAKVTPRCAVSKFKKK